MDIPEIDARILFDAGHAGHQTALNDVRVAAESIGFMTLAHTAVTREDVQDVLDMYRSFFLLPAHRKADYDMAATASNRGWGAPGAEQVDPTANPDFKEVFDCGPELPAGDPLGSENYYAPNQWPEEPAAFRAVVTRYYQQASSTSLALLSAIAKALGEPPDYFTDKFDKPMALLRGNYYPPRPPQATGRDFGIAPHTDYGCLTFLATDGSPGLEVRTRDEQWIPLSASPGTFIINFGEMLQMWTDGRVVATPHRVVGGQQERLSVPFFFNPRSDVNVAPLDSGRTILAGDHLAKRYDQTYVHRQNPAAGAEAAVVAGGRTARESLSSE